MSTSVGFPEVGEVVIRAICRNLSIHVCEPGNPWREGTENCVHPFATTHKADKLTFMYCPVCDYQWRKA